MNKIASALLLSVALGAQAQSAAPAASAASAAPAASASASGAGNQPEPMVVLVPVEVKNPALESGCWAQLYDERNFKGDMLTIVGPMELQSLDKATGRHLRHSIDSVVLGPKAKLTVYEHRMFKDRSVNFEPNAKEGSLLRKIGITGRVQSLRLQCTQ